jgi:two-component system response regulator DctR
MIRVLLIEDDPMVLEVNRQFVERVQGFTVVGVAHNGMEGIKKIGEVKPDLVLLDIYMPLQDGLATIMRIREAFPVDVIVITAANDAPTIQHMLRNGVFDYILKPFKFERIEQSLKDYLAFATKLKTGQFMSQDDVDNLVYGKSAKGNADPVKKGNTLPKGINEITLNRILVFMMDKSMALSAEEVADGVGIARVTARRYLEYLEEKGNVLLDIQYGGIGRPVNRYRFQRF